MKKILCLIDSLGSGGAQRQLVGLAKLLNDKEEYNVKVVWYHDKNFYQKYLEENNVQYENIVVKNKFTKFFTIYKAVKDFSPDVVIAYIDGPAVIASVIRMFNSNFRLIVSERNTTQKLNLKSKIKFYLYKRADIIVPNSYSQARFIERNYPNLYSKVRTITNFTDTDFFSPATYAESSECVNILVVGRIVEQKNVLLFIKAISKIIEKGVNIKVDWYGVPYYKEYYEKCVAEINKLKVNSFTFHSHSSDVRSLYRKANVFCLPSLYEGYPNVICEAMSCGLPILCSNVCDNPNIVEHGVNGFLFDPNDINDIVEKILIFLSLPITERVTMGEKSRNIAIEKFSKITFLKKYENIICQ